MTVVRSRLAGMGAQEARNRPVYARVLRLKYLRPSGLLCFLFFEGSIALAVLLSLAELVNGWAIAALPAAVAAMVKLNDIIAGAIAYSGAAKPIKRTKVYGRATVPQRAVGPVRRSPADERVGSPEQRARQAARRRYE